MNGLIKYSYLGLGLTPLVEVWAPTEKTGFWAPKLWLKNMVDDYPMGSESVKTNHQLYTNKRNTKKCKDV